MTESLSLQILTDVPLVGAASDKVAALEKAGVTVTDSPAKIGSTMLKVRPLCASKNFDLMIASVGYARSRPGVECLEE